MRGSHFTELVSVLDRLRSPGGCAWDAEQTHQSLVEYLIEESYEVVEAIESGDTNAMREELGDLLLQVVFHSRIAQDDMEGFDIDDVIDGITHKLIARHPHVVVPGTDQSGTDQSGTDLSGTDLSSTDINDSWHERKAREKGRSSLTEGVPVTLPALMRAAKIQARTRRLPIHTDADDAPIQRKAQEVVQGLTNSTEFGEFLWSLVQVAGDRGWDAEASLRGAIGSHIDQIREMERKISHEQRSPKP